MDPLTAFSTAGTVIQFVDFSLKLLSAGCELYNSATGALYTNEELEYTARNISQLAQRLRQPLHPESLIRVTQEGADLQRICDKCDEIAQDLLKRLESLRMADGKGVLKSFRYVLKTYWAKEDLDILVDRLEKIREILEMTVLVELREQFNSISLQHSDRFDNLDSQSRHIITALLDFKNALPKDLRDQTLAVSLMLNHVEELIARHHGITRTMIIGAIGDARTQAKSDLDNCPDNIRISPTDRNDAKLKATVEDGILNDLRFVAMRDRYGQVAEAHQSTFKWIFRDYMDESRLIKWDSFPEWLREGKNVYWINGKAGSGKSTLMRYIYNHPSTRQNLKVWAREETLLIAGFFFWNSGTPEQRSQVGLLRTLLYEILHEHRDLIPVIMPSLWARKYSQALDPSIHYEVEPISLTILIKVFTALIHQTTISIKICFFIDGLDEYDGSHSKIAGLFTKIAESSNVKVCLSSRPLLVFEDSFSIVSSLRLQDLTFDDIRSYVNDNLNSDKGYQKLSIKEPILVPTLVEEIVTKADGVFLWVRLVVESLLSGLEYRDEISDLQKRLRHLPTDLEKLYEHMLMTRIDPFYMTSASKMFQIVREAREIQPSTPLTVLAFAFADDSSAGWPITTLHNPLSQEDQSRYCQIMEDRMKARCAGLLEVSAIDEAHLHPLDLKHHYGGKVQYLHRTVHDYLEQPEVWSLLISHTASTDFHPSISLLRSCVLQLRTAPKHSELGTLRDTAIAALRYASRVKLDASFISVSLLDQLAQTMEIQVAKICPNESGLWATRSFSPKEWHDSFISIAIQYDLRTYVDRTLSTNSMLIHKPGRPLLRYALGGDRFPGYENGDSRSLSNNRSSSSNRSLSSKEMVEILLRHGALLSANFDGETAWQLVTRGTHERCTEANFLPDQLEIIRLFLQYGADPDELHHDIHGRPHSAREIIQHALKIHRPVNAVEIETMLTRRPTNPLPVEKDRINNNIKKRAPLRQRFILWSTQRSRSNG